jgi:DNA-damage-inducible protein D
MTIFDAIKKINIHNQEYRQARELAKVLEYADFWNFEGVIKKAQQTCKSSWQDIANHFGESTEMVALGSWSERWFPSYQLSRYACYLIAMEADGSKPQVALAKSYFAIQTRNQELQQQALEDQKRMYLREPCKNS